MTANALIAPLFRTAMNALIPSWAAAQRRAGREMGSFRGQVELFLPMVSCFLFVFVLFVGYHKGNWVANVGRICDDNNNNAGCDWDGGDCCDKSSNFAYCSKCECLDCTAECAANCAQTKWQGDGYCGALCLPVVPCCETIKWRTSLLSASDPSHYCGLNFWLLNCRRWQQQLRLRLGWRRLLWRFSC